MQKQKKESHLLEEIFKNAHVGMQSINDLMPKVDDADLKKELARMYENFDNISSKAKTLADEANIDLKAMNIFQKAMVWSGIQWNTLKDSSSTNIMSMLAQGSVTGYSSLLQTLQSYHDTESKAYKLAMELIKIEQEDEKRLTAMMMAGK